MSQDRVHEIRERVRASILKDIKGFGRYRALEFMLPLVGACQERDLTHLLAIMSNSFKHLTRPAKRKVSD